SLSHQRGSGPGSPQVSIGAHKSDFSPRIVLFRFGMTGAGKSVIVADLLAQIGHRFGFRLIVEEGLSHAVLTQTQGCEPVIINPNGCSSDSKRVEARNATS